MDAMNVIKGSAVHQKFIEHWMRKNYEAVGFLPGAAVQEYLDAGHCSIVNQNGQPAGYILHRAQLRSMRWVRPLTQIAVAFDARRNSAGRRLITSVAAAGKRAGAQALQAWVAEELEANEFFHAAGFVPIIARREENRRGRLLILWRLPLAQVRHVDFMQVPKVAGCVPTSIEESQLIPIAQLGERFQRIVSS